MQERVALHLLAQQGLPQVGDPPHGLRPYGQVVLPVMRVRSTGSANLRDEPVSARLAQPDPDPVEREVCQERIDAVLQEDP